MRDGGVLYSFRRCPYAIRARLALAEAGLSVAVREVALRAKPPELLECSPKGTVPVLVRPDGEILEESQAILLWALGQDAQRLRARQALQEGAAAALVAECDGPFKRHLDGFRYGNPVHRDGHREAALAILRRWSGSLGARAGGAVVLAEGAAIGGIPDDTMAGDGGSSPGGSEPGGWEPLGWAVLPFVRQFRLSDPEGFARAPGLDRLKNWLLAFEGSVALARVMEPPWAWRQPWRSPRWLYHLALEEEWREARRQGVYSRSTRGMSLADVGFIHASWSHQVEATWRRFYGDGPALRLLMIDPARLAARGLPVREEPAPDSGERFPHIYGPLPLDAVLLALPFRPAVETFRH